MTRSLRKILFVTALLLINAPLFSWERVLNKDGIAIYTRQAKDARIHEIKGTALIDAPMLQVLNVVLDYRKFKEWQPRLIVFERLREISDVEFINYAAMKMPWPVKNRDMVMRARFLIDRDNRWFHVTWKDTTWPAKPVTSRYVRVPKSRVKWSLRPAAGGKKTWVEFRALGDPGGLIPAWLVNYFSRYTLADSLRRLGKQVRKKSFDPVLMERYRYVRDWY